MGKVDAKRCPACGHGTIEARNLRGHVVPFRDEPTVLVCEDLFVPRCNTCGESLLNEQAAIEYDSVLQRLYEQQRISQQRREIEKTLSALRINQSELEGLLGVSQGYVSKMLRGEKVTSATTIRLLHVLASDPPRVVRALAEIVPVGETLLARLRGARSAAG